MPGGTSPVQKRNAALVDLLATDFVRRKELNIVPGGGDTVSEGPGIDITGATPKVIGLGGDTILLYDSGGSPVAEAAATSVGLDAILALAVSGDVVWLPAITISGNHTVPAGVVMQGISRFASRLSGQITCATGSRLENLTLVRSANDESDLIGVVAAGETEISNAIIEVYQLGAGNAYALQSLTGRITTWSCSIYAVSTGGSGYAGHIRGASIYIYGGRTWGSTDVYNV